MSINNLLNILKTPDEPVEYTNSDFWELYEHIAGVSLPEDYKEYLNLFGTGIIGGLIIPYNPLCKRNLWQVRYSFYNWVRDALGIINNKHQFGEAVFPYTVYPQEGGVVPWGQTENGDRLYWLTLGLPENWIVLVNEVRSSNFEIFELSMTDFLGKLITGEIQSNIILYEELDQSNLFETI